LFIIRFHNDYDYNMDNNRDYNNNMSHKNMDRSSMDRGFAEGDIAEIGMVVILVGGMVVEVRWVRWVLRQRGLIFVSYLRVSWLLCVVWS
jgi:hypothetical protein